MKNISYLLVFVSAISTLFIELYVAESYSLAVMGYIAWGITPYFYLALLVKLATQKIILSVLVIVLFTCIFGVGLLIDAMFIHLDAQGGLIIPFGSLYQWIIVLFLSTLLFILSEIKMYN